MHGNRLLISMSRIFFVNMTRARLSIFVVLLVCLFQHSMKAQHAGFVLFGDRNPQADKADAEHQFVHPLTAPFYHEDSFITTDLRAWYLNHDFPVSSPIAGGNAQAGALQVRLALTDRLQLVAYKDGYIDFNTGLIDESGFTDIAAGLKWNWLQDWDRQFHSAVGAGYELKTGQGRVLQNDDEFRLWASLNKGFGKLHLGANANYFMAREKDRGLGSSDRVSWHLHADYWTCKWFSPVLEINGYHVVDEGPPGLPFHGLDLVNIGGGQGEEAIALGIGGAFRPCKDLSLRVAYETPLTQEEDLFGYRWTISAVLSF